MNELEPMGTDDIAPTLGQQQLTIIQLQKTLAARDKRIAELETRKPLDEDLAAVDGHLEGVK